jgi:two-component system response regulator RegA
MNPSMLVIDDDPHFGQVMVRSLERQNYSAHWIASADELIQIEQAPDFISLDLRLEHSSGLDVIDTLLERWPSTRIVILTGYASIPTAVEAIKRGAHNYLHKPATLQELLRAFNDTPAINTEQDESVMSVDRMEWEHIQRVLNEHGGNISATARALNMHRRTLQRKLQKHAPRS